MALHKYIIYEIKNGLKNDFHFANYCLSKGRDWFIPTTIDHLTVSWVKYTKFAKGYS